jgi:NCAIR mutase (PurE)-related protein
VPAKKTTSKSAHRNKTTPEWLLETLEKVKSGKLTPEQAVEKLSLLPYEDVGCAKIDHHRSLRVGFPEVIFGRGKTTEQIATISQHLIARSERLLVTHAGPEAYNAVKAIISDAKFNPVARTIVVNRTKKPAARAGIAVITGGTADIPVAEEAAVTAELMGNKVERIFDVGVAGIHRLLDQLPRLRKCKVLVVVAGMEGALPGVVGGLVSIPIIAVPTSVGYGTGFNGLAPLLTMLNSCAPGLGVVNIDNGFGAGYLAGLINLQSKGNK